MTHEEFIESHLRNKKWHIKDGILYVDDYLNLQGMEITSLPEKLYISGRLDLRNTAIASLPERLHVGEWLDLEKTNITSLPEGLSVGDWLDLRGTKITSLPNKLTIIGSLALYGTKITSLPEDLVVGDILPASVQFTMTEKAQLNLIPQRKYHFKNIKRPTKKAVVLNNLLWRL